MIVCFVCFVFDQIAEAEEVWWHVGHISQNRTKQCASSIWSFCREDKKMMESDGSCVSLFRFVQFVLVG